MQTDKITWLTVRDVAQILNISLASAYRIVDEGKLPAFRLCSKAGLKVKETDLQNYIEDCQN